MGFYYEVKQFDLMHTELQKLLEVQITMNGGEKNQKVLTSYDLLINYYLIK